jgi:hypothetical protein
VSDLLEQHLRLIEAGGAAVAVNDIQEAAVVRDLALPPLRLPPRLPSPAAMRRRRWGMSAGFLAVAAALTFFILKHPTDGQINFKGGVAKSWIVWQRDGKSLAWQPGAPGRVGDRFTAEVSAEFDSTAFLAVYDRDGRLLVPARDVVAGHLDLGAGERALFSRSFELTEADDGEVLVVVVCHNASLKAAYPDLESFWLAVRPLGRPDESMPRGCQVDQYPLR